MQLSLNQNQLTIQLEWYEQLLAFTLHNPIVVPLDHLLQVTTEEPPSRWTDLRAPGTHLPGVIKAGTYYTRQGREFWYATVDRHFLVLELREEPYQKIVLTVENHREWLDRITQATMPLD
ncbi:hypothetical protein C7293_15670 [filamentous cyanobacterium CCT1]|nr:hypothetical protein C7293_15670 [filamentous cyanobacterium CCT1]PSN80339.1 hypothetical protein C8B47_07035 [filamentous cyanobacterium CCP4]